jgi:hypothetical protein
MNKRTTGDKITDAIAAATLAVCLLAIAFGAGKAEAASGNTGNVNLVATFKGTHAFQTVVWTVTKTKSENTVKTSNAHCLNIPLVTGNYEARLECNGNNRHRTFTIAAGSTNDIVIACD